jgi:hypothetical protein
MTLENYLAEAGALAGLAGVLAGFSLTAVVQLLTAGNFCRHLHMSDHLRDRGCHLALYVKKLGVLLRKNSEFNVQRILNICISFIARFRSPASLIFPCMNACMPSSSPVKILT